MAPNPLNYKLYGHYSSYWPLSLSLSKWSIVLIKLGTCLLHQFKLGSESLEVISVCVSVRKSAEGISILREEEIKLIIMGLKSEVWWSFCMVWKKKKIFKWRKSVFGWTPKYSHLEMVKLMKKTEKCLKYINIQPLVVMFSLKVFQILTN